MNHLNMLLLPIEAPEAELVWARHQKDTPSRLEAIHRLIEMALAAKEKTKHRQKAGLFVATPEIAINEGFHRRERWGPRGMTTKAAPEKKLGRQ
jgi:hypothetical protein